MDEPALREWLVMRLAGLLGVLPEEIGIDLRLEQLGVDSAAALVLTGDLSELLGRQVPPDMPFLYPTIARLARSLGAHP